MKTIISIATLFILTINVSQGQSKTVFVIDSIPYFSNLPYIQCLTAEELFLYDDEIESTRIVTDTMEKRRYGCIGVDTIIVVKTKEMQTRPAERWRIPNKKQFQAIDGLYYYKNSDKPYSGPYIDFNTNGTLKETGNLIDGSINGIVNTYDKRGRLAKAEFKTKGVRTGSYIEYWSNGRIKISKEEMVSCYFSSTGQLLLEQSPSGMYSNEYQKLRKNTFVHIGEILPKSWIKDGKKYRDYLSEYKDGNYLVNPNSYLTYQHLSVTLFLSGEIDNAIKMLDSAISLEPLDFESRMFRLYCRIFKYENSSFKSIKKFRKSSNTEPTYRYEKNAADTASISDDIKVLKEQGYIHICKFTYEDNEGYDVGLCTDIQMAEKIYYNKGVD